MQRTYTQMCSNEDSSNDCWVYCFVNEDGLFRIGKTKRVAQRLSQLKKEGPFTLCFAKKVNAPNNKVKIICNLLSKYRTDNNLYKIENINSIRQMFELMDGEWYNDQIQYKKKEPVCNEELIKQYLEERTLNNLGGTHF